MNGSEQSLNKKPSGASKIIRIDDKRDVPKFGGIFEEYVKSAGAEATHGEDLMISIFTKIENPGTLLLVAFEEEEPVGFIWAQPAVQLQQPYLRVSELYSKVNGIGLDLFRDAKIWAEEVGFKCIKGLVSKEKALAMERLFDAKEEAVLITVEF